MTTIPNQGGTTQIDAAGNVVTRELIVVDPVAPDDKRLARLSPAAQFGEQQVRAVRGALEDHRRAEMEEQEKINLAIGDPRYRSDPIYRADVEKKVLAGEFGSVASQNKMAPYNAELQRTGNLSENSVARASKELGVPPSVVRQHVDGVRAQEHSMAAALEQAQYSTIMEITGTEAAADQLDAWLRLNDPEAREAIRSAANGRSPGHTRVLVSNAWKNFKQATATHR